MELLAQLTFPLTALIACRWWFRRFRAIDIAPILLLVIGAAVAAGRVAFILSHGDAYLGAPLEVLNLADGGSSAAAAMFAGLAVAAQRTGRAPALRKPLALALAMAMAAWGAALVAVPILRNAPMMLPAVALERLDASPANLAGFAGQPVVVNLWASWCPACRQEMPLLGEAQTRRPGTAFVFVNQGEDGAAIRRFLHDERLALGNVFGDRLSQAGRKTSSPVLPTTLFFDRRGVLVSRHVGAFSADSLAAELAKLDAAR